MSLGFLPNLGGFEGPVHDRAPQGAEAIEHP